MLDCQRKKFCYHSNKQNSEIVLLYDTKCNETLKKTQTLGYAKFLIWAMFHAVNTKTMILLLTGTAIRTNCLYIRKEQIAM